MNSVLKYLPIFTLWTSVASAGGIAFFKIDALEDAIKKQDTNQQQIQKIQVQQAQSDTRQEMMIEMLKEIKQDLKDRQ